MSLSVTRPLVYLVTAGECDASNFAEASARVLDSVRAAVDAGVDLIQIREKRLGGKLLFELTREAAEIVKGSETNLLVNDRLDIAMAAKADGVHLSAASLPVAAVREHVDDEFIVGVSTHVADEVTAAAVAGADLAMFGPVFATPGKGDGVGIDELKDASAVAGTMLVLGIGGIDETNYRDVLQAGAAGFAAIRSLNAADTMQRIMKEIRR